MPGEPEGRLVTPSAIPHSNASEYHQSSPVTLSLIWREIWLSVIIHRCWKR